MANTDAIIVGGGLAGAATAITAARRGQCVTLYEREHAAHHKVCGEFLSVSSLSALDALALSPAALGAVALRHVRVCAGGAPVEAPLPFRALSLSRKVLDAALLEAAEDAGVRVVRGTRVNGVSGGRPYDVRHSRGTDRCDVLVIATGKTDLRGHGRPKGIHGGMVGLKRLVTPRSPPEPVIDLVLFRGGYAGIQPIEDGRLNVCLAVDAPTLRRLGIAGVFETVLAAAPHLAQTLHDHAQAQTHATANIPYGMVRPITTGPAFVGDQAAVIASMLGEGMAIALTSGAALGAVLGDEDAMTAAMARTRRQAGVRVRASGLLSRLACGRAGAPLMRGIAGLHPRVLTTVAAYSRLPSSGTPALP